MVEDVVGAAIEEMVDFFLPYCRDTSTLTQLKKMAGNRKLRRKGHDLFSRIREKTLRANDDNDRFLQHQYSFEEICAKTLFNMSGCPGPPYPFDDDSPFLVIPIALHFAYYLEVDDPYAITRLLRPTSD